MLHSRELPEKLETFCKAYITFWNSRMAAEAVSPKRGNAATTLGDRLLRRADVRRRIDELQEMNSDYYDRLKKRIISEQTTIAFSDLKEVYNLSSMTLADLKNIDGRLVRSVSQNKDGTFNITLWDKHKSLEFLGKHLGMLDQHIDVTTDGKPINITVNSAGVAAALNDALANTETD